MGFFDDRGELGPPPEPFRFAGRRDPRTSQLRWVGFAALLLVVYVALNVLKSTFVDYLWFDSVGFQSVFTTVLFIKVALFFGGAAITVVVIGANVWLARRLAPRGPEESFIEEIDPEAIRRLVTVLLVAGTLFFGVVFGSIASGAWDIALSAARSTSFGQTDPQFGRDLGFYVFTLPAFHFVEGWAIGLLVVAAAAAASVYALAVSLQRFELNITAGMRTHLSIVVGLIFLLIAVNTYLSIFDLVESTSGFVFGATYTDVNARLPVRYILVALAAFTGIVTMANAFLSPSGFRAPIFAFGLWSFAGLVGGALYPTAVQSLQVEPNQRLLEAPYIQRNITATRYAYGLDRIKETPFPAALSVTQQEIDANPQTLSNIRLLDPIPLRDTFNQIQAIRPFYVFNDVDVDRYTIDGKTTQVMEAARELDATKAQSANWTSLRLQLTHGFGAVIAPVNKIGAEGLPQLLTLDIPPKSDVIPINPTGARIYFGEKTDQYIIGKSSEPEFDYPVGDGNAQTSYPENRGIKLDSPIRRLALAWELNDANLVISGQITPDSRLLMRRDIQDRVSHVAPFLRFDADPYMVVIDGRIMWIMPAYTATERMPYSQPSNGDLGRANYIRNSVQVTVDGETGDMHFYLTDAADPIVETWARIFPNLFEANAAMPAAIRAHLRYPLDLFKLQSQLYLRYHITDPSVFFIGEDLWNIPTEKFQSKEQPIQPYYVVMALPEEGPRGGVEQKVEFVLIMPFTPRNRQNTVSWLAGRSDGADFGALRAYRFPTENVVYGPAQIEARIDQNPGISSQITLWDQSGSNVIRGNLLMIPIGNSFLFVEPIYLQAQNSKLPELVRVVVANGNNIAMENTFADALDVVMGKKPSSLGAVTQTPGGVAAGAPTGPSAGNAPAPSATPRPTPAAGATPSGIPTGTIEELLRQARQSSDSTQADLDRLRAILDAIQKQIQTPTATPTPAR